MKFFRIFLTILFICLCASNLNAETIYTWTDENGVKHFSDTPPPDKKLQDLKIRGTDNHRTEPSKKDLSTESSQPQTNILEFLEKEHNRANKCSELHFKKAELLKEQLSLFQQRTEAVIKKIKQTPNPTPEILNLIRLLERKLDDNEFQQKIVDRKKREFRCNIKPYLIKEGEK